MTKVNCADNAMHAAGIDVLVRARRNCDPLLRTAVESLAEPLATMVGYHFGWWDSQRHEVPATYGKFVRSAVAYGAATAFGGAAALANPVAAGVELLHNFMLIHDDIMDGDETRRGRPTIWKVWGVNNAILAGDALHALAIKLLAESKLLGHSAAVDAISRLEESCLTASSGQLEDCGFEGDVTVGVAEYLRMAGAKTASLMACACALGALSVNAADEAVNAMEKFGYELGLAFQIIDDIIGIWGDPTQIGKPVGADLIRRKATLPVIAALNSRCNAGMDLRALYCSEAAMTRRDVARATELIEAASGRQAAHHHATERIRSAWAQLPEGPAAADLVSLLQLLISKSRQQESMMTQAEIRVTRARPRSTESATESP